MAERLRQATAEGRLRPDELEARLGAALSASTHGELDSLVADLPRTPVARRRHVSLPLLPLAIALVIAIPLALALVAAVLFVVSGLFATWAIWLLLGWFFVSRRHRCVVSHRRTACRSRRAHVGTGFWL